ncbi:serine hydrolase [Muriicola sp. Z0-33]|uniref:serine hydrolase n=1 Tax=Muriicola sp. Z0-33 TaxID=2816957 RepID=UPI0022374A50|nr:serine hydrolase [Muriicola sp. Z0-33]MCW5515491.1 serine hydrolase [Muriicola sp. Z0-33]
MLKNLFFFLLVGALFCCQAQTKLSDEVIENIKLRIDNGKNPGIVIGIIDQEGTRYHSFGVKSLKTDEPVNEYSIFEIGSISKTFTGILLADMVVKGKLNLEDPLQILLPDGVKAPTRNGVSIKLVHMANHTSSLPRMPDNFNPANPANPYIDYSEKQLYDFLNSYELSRDIGSKYEYSNYAAGLLGHLLAAKNNTTYEELMLSVIANPLKMENTGILLTPEMSKHLATGHRGRIEVENWDLTTLAGAGAIRSSAVDMIKYLAANMGMVKTKLYPAMQLSHKNSRAEGAEPIVGLGWHTQVFDEEEIIWHNGGTGGYRTFAGFTKDGSKGVVVLCNSTTGADDLGRHLLYSKSPLNKIKSSIGAKMLQVIERDGLTAALDTYSELKKSPIDIYDFSENELNDLGYYFLARKELENALAVFKLNIENYPNSSNVYDSYGEAFMEKGNKEKAIENYEKSVAINPGNLNGLDKLKELGVDTNKLVTEIVVDEGILENYVGKYELAPGFILTVTRNEKQLNVQATGQPQFPVFPKSSSVFYYKVVEAQLTFNRNEDDKVESLTLLQGGRTMVGSKIE